MFENNMHSKKKKKEKKRGTWRLNCNSPTQNESAEHVKIVYIYIWLSVRLIEDKLS